MATSVSHEHPQHTANIHINNSESHSSSNPFSPSIVSNGGGNGLFPVFSLFGGGWLKINHYDYYKYYNLSASIESIKVTALKNVKPGTYEFPISISYINGGAWIAMTKYIKVTVIPATCTLQNRNIKFGQISPGSIVKKDLDLGLKCNDNINNLYHASWMYTNTKAKNDTNLKNVFVNIINNKTDRLIKSGVKNKDLNLLQGNNLTIEIDAKPDAQVGILKGTLNFTLTYF